MKGSGNRSYARKSLAPPTSATDVVREVTLQLARKYLFFDLYKKAAIYFFAVTVLSLLAPYLPLLHDWYFDQKGNILNVMFVKLGWFWTSSVTFVFVYMTAAVFSMGRTFDIARHLLRVLVASLVWYLCTSWFVNFERQTSRCVGMVNADSRTECASEGGKWMAGFDISGHCFLLIYCSMFISEEAAAFRDWDRLRMLLQSPEKSLSSFENASPAELQAGQRLHQSKTMAIKLLFIGLFIFHVLWDFMLVITVLYYHTFAHKISGALIALVVWFLTYRVWYRLPVSPGLPGQCRIKYDRRLSRTK